MKLTFALLLLSAIAFQEGLCWSKDHKFEKHHLKTTKAAEEVQEVIEPEGIENSKLRIFDEIVKKKEKIIDPVVATLYLAAAKLLYVVKVIEDKKAEIVNNVYDKFTDFDYNLENVHHKETLLKHGDKNEKNVLQDEFLIPYTTAQYVSNHGSKKAVSSGQKEESSLGQHSHKGVASPKGTVADHSSHKGHVGHSSHEGIIIDTREGIEYVSQEHEPHDTYKGVSFGQPFVHRRALFGPNTPEEVEYESQGHDSHKGVSFGQPSQEEEESADFGSGDGEVPESQVEFFPQIYLDIPAGVLPLQGEQ